MNKIFEEYVTYHRKLIIEGIKKYPKYFKYSDLHEFDSVILTSIYNLKKQGLYENWEPMFYLNSPIEFLFLTEQKVFSKAYLESSNENDILLEEISSEIPADVSAAMQSQIDSVKQLTDEYRALTNDQKRELNRRAVVATKSNKDFEDELQDIEDEINAIYGKLEKGGFLNNKFKQVFGGLERMAGTVGFGTVNEESKMLNEAPLDLASVKAAKIADLLRNYLSTSDANIIPRGLMDKLAQNYNVGLDDIANVAHRMVGTNVQGTFGTFTPYSMVHKLKPLGPKPTELIIKGQGAAATKGSAATGIKTATTGAKAKGIATGLKAKSLATGTKGVLAAGAKAKGAATAATAASSGLIGLVGAGALALIASGLAVAKMNKRKNRIKVLKNILKTFSAESGIKSMIREEIRALVLSKKF